MSDSKFEYIDDVLLNVDKDKIEKLELPGIDFIKRKNLP